MNSSTRSGPISRPRNSALSWMASAPATVGSEPWWHDVGQVGRPCPAAVVSRGDGWPWVTGCLARRSVVPCADRHRFGTDGVGARLHARHRAHPDTDRARGSFRVGGDGRDRTARRLRLAAVDGALHAWSWPDGAGRCDLCGLHRVDPAGGLWAYGAAR